jgi:quinol monooxygenase YgiN
MSYGRFGTLNARPGHRDRIVEILLRGADSLRDAGCDLYLVGVPADRPDAVVVTEVWSSPEAHRASLQLPSVRAAIAEAMPMLTGEFESVEFSVVGGLGAPAG